eukprot:5049088-Alexandrium_andersonii.AAC.1
MPIHLIGGSWRAASSACKDVVCRRSCTASRASALEGVIHRADRCACARRCSVLPGTAGAPEDRAAIEEPGLRANCCCRGAPNNRCWSCCCAGVGLPF